MIEPFLEKQKGHGRISYGLSSYGYDIRLADEYRIFSSARGAVVDPKDFSGEAFVSHRGKCCVIPPQSYVLASSLERFHMPCGVLAICTGKSTYARCGIVVNVTPLEPGWTGQLTMCIANTSPLPVKVYSGEGIAQVLFLEGDELCAVSYADRGGKYQSQVGIVLPRVLSKSRLRGKRGRA
jgi:dCTP deaminase